MQGRTVVVLLVAGMVLPACTYERTGAPARHYTEFRVAPPTQFNKVEVCHAYTCKQKSPYYFRKPDIAELAALMRKVKRADTPYEERRAMAYAIGRIERDVGKKLGLKDNPGMSFRSSGDQNDVVALCGDLAGKFPADSAGCAGYQREACWGTVQLSVDGCVLGVQFNETSPGVNSIAH